MNIFASRLSTQVGVILFLCLSITTLLISWVFYTNSNKQLVQDATSLATEETEYLAMGIANPVLYNKVYPIWVQMKKIVESHDQHAQLASPIQFAVTNETQQVLAHSNLEDFPLMSNLPLGDQNTTWDTDHKIHVIQPIYHPSSSRIIGHLSMTFDASPIKNRLSEIRNDIALLVASSILLSLLIAIGVRFRVAKPLKEITAAAKTIGSGNTVVKNIDDKPLEIRRLAKSIMDADQNVVNQTREIEKLATVLHQTEELVILTDTDGNIQYVNPSFERVSGFSKEDAIGQTSRIVKSGEHSPEFYSAMWKHILSGKTWAAGFTNKSKSGDLYQVSQTISPIFEKGKITGFVAVQRDVTQAKKIETKLNHTDRVESLGVLAGGIAHDFNNILTAILGNASLALNKVDATSPSFEHLERIKDASMSAADLCKQMLAYSGKGKFVVKQVNLSDLIESMSKLVEVSIAKNVIMNYKLTTPMPFIDADIAQVQQVLLNLITNASEAIGDRSGIITFMTGVMHTDSEYLYSCIGEPNLEEGRYAYVEVSDTGCGMDADILKKIFDPFFTTKFSGRGLGMSAMLGITKGHSGAMRIYSEVNKGTTMRVLFPVSSGRISEDTLDSTPIPINATGTVLIVDDDESIREIGSSMLENMGYETRTACNGIEGVQTYKEHQEDIIFVLLDMTMPKLDGQGCFKQLKKINPHVKVILSSGYNEQEATSSFVGKGLAGFIQKPYTLSALSEKIASLGDQ
ncbi:MAG: response regulator [Ghiorsea sp.]